MCDIITVLVELVLSLCSDNSKSGRLSGLPLFFLHELWYNDLNKSSRPLEEAH
nr:MAG TPA: hypothetical protein [Bacteriophage sp.]